jgi:hypothetical protein
MRVKRDDAHHSGGGVATIAPAFLNREKSAAMYFSNLGLGYSSRLPVSLLIFVPFNHIARRPKFKAVVQVFSQHYWLMR